MTKIMSTYELNNLLHQLFSILGVKNPTFRKFLIDNDKTDRKLLKSNK